MPHIYATRWFKRWARKQGLTHEDLKRAVEEMGAGLFDANLGGGLLKKRIGRPGQGKRGGWRTLVAANWQGRWVFLYGFAKNERDNVGPDEEAALKRLAAHVLALNGKALDRALAADELTEIPDHAQDTFPDS